MSGSINNVLTSQTRSNEDTKDRQLEQNSEHTASNLSINYEHAINQASQEPEQDADHNVSGTFLNNESWILDSGATDHITNDMNNYVTYKAIKPITIRLPNNLTILAKHSGIYLSL
ncbi:hypothetical protein Lal_00006255 [Lupinus albus]|nr:hypothetical protein Lal_00006255 [Lupinus albus]